MKVKISDKIYDSNDTAILLILDPEEKQLISNMGEQLKFCSYPLEMAPEEATEFMKMN
jgi:hypothetical protein